MNFFKIVEDTPIPNTDIILEKNDIVVIENDELKEKIKEAKTKKNLPKRNVYTLPEDVEINGEKLPTGTVIQVLEADMQYTFGWGEPKLVKAKYKTKLSPDEEEELKEILFDQIGIETQVDFTEEKVEWLVQFYQNEGYPANRRAMEDFARQMIDEYDDYIKSIIDNLKAEAEFMEEYNLSEEGYGDLSYLMPENDFMYGTLPETIMEAIRRNYDRNEVETIKSEILNECFEDLEIKYDYETGYSSPHAEDSNEHIYYGSLGSIREDEIQLPDELTEKLEKLSKEEFEIVQDAVDDVMSLRDTRWAMVYMDVIPYWYSPIRGNERDINEILNRYNLEVQL